MGMEKGPEIGGARKAGDEYCAGALDFLQERMGRENLHIDEVENFIRVFSSRAVVTAFAMVKAKFDDDRARKWLNDFFQELSASLVKVGVKSSIVEVAKDLDKREDPSELN